MEQVQRMLNYKISRAGGNNVQRNHIQASGMSADSVLAWEIVYKMNRLPKKKGFERKFEILGTISQPGVLSADMPAS